MALAEGRRRLLIPAFAGFYGWGRPLYYPLIRCALGMSVFVDGWSRGLDTPTTPYTGLAAASLETTGSFLVVLILTETIGGVCLAIGLLTRFWALALAAELAYVAATSHAQYPYLEQLLLWCSLGAAIILRGGGRYSIDHILGWEL